MGAGLVVVARALLPGDGGHSPLQGLGTQPTPLEAGPGVALAALGTLAFGAVLGPEAPLIALGSIVGVAAARLRRLGERENAVLATAGSFSPSRRCSAARWSPGCCWSRPASAPARL